MNVCDLSLRRFIGCATNNTTYELASQDEQVKADATRRLQQRQQWLTTNHLPTWKTIHVAFPIFLTLGLFFATLAAIVLGLYLGYSSKNASDVLVSVITCGGSALAGGRGVASSLNWIDDTLKRFNQYKQPQWLRDKICEINITDLASLAEKNTSCYYFSMLPAYVYSGLLSKSDAYKIWDLIEKYSEAKKNGTEEELNQLENEWSAFKGGVVWPDIHQDSSDEVV